MAPNAWDSLKQVLPPDVLDALSNNQPLSPGVLQTALALREHPSSCTSTIVARLNAIIEEIITLKAEIECVVNKDSRHRAMNEACAVLCAPIRRIPDDLLLEIARHSMDDQPSPVRTATPINLSHLSSTWRDVVVNSPGLWTTLYLRVPTLSNVAFLIKQIQIVETWFGRASSLPLSLFLHVTPTIDPNTQEAYNFNQFLKAIAQWAPRLRILGVGGLDWVNLMANFVDIEWDLENLRELHFLGQRWENPDAFQDDMDILASVQERLILFRGAKRLVSVVVAQEMTSFLQSFQFIPWDQIQHASMTEEAPSGTKLSSLFTQCPNLRTAFISWIKPKFSNIGHCSTNLEQLELYGLTIDDYGELESFLTRIACPRLTHLVINLFEVKAPQETLLVEPSIAIPAFKYLSVLWLAGDTRLPTEFVLDLLGKMPALQILHLQLVFVHDHPCAIDLNHLCKAMTISNDQLHDDLLPCLEECTFWRSNNEHERWQARTSTLVIPKLDLLDVTMISRFISSRAYCNPLSPIRSKALRKVSFLGSFAFMTDLCKEVLRISSGKPSVEITVVQDLRLENEPDISNSQYGPGFRRSPFCLDFSYNDGPSCPGYYPDYLSDSERDTESDAGASGH